MRTLLQIFIAATFALSAGAANAQQRVTISTEPYGFTYVVDDMPYSTPQTFLWESGAEHTIWVNSPQESVVGNDFAFDSWSDGGAVEHAVAATGDTSFVARFALAADPRDLEWREAARFGPSDGASDDNFGYSVSVSGDVCVVGARWYGIDSPGSAYVFRRNGDGGWTEEQKLVAADGANGDRFGYSVSIFGNVCVVGAPGDDDNGSSSGSVYVFRHDPESETWVQESKLVASDGAHHDQFGTSVSVSGDVCAVAAPHDWTNGTGSAYVYRYNAAGDKWSEERKLVSSDGADRFGESISVSVDACAVGRPYDDGNTGSVYVFNYDSAGDKWSEERKLVASDADSFDVFGHSVSVSGNALVAGAGGDEENGYRSGSSYVFRRDRDGTWAQEQKLLASDGSESSYFGISVAISGDVCVIGAIGGGASGSRSGAAYIFELTDAPTSATLGQPASFSLSQNTPNPFNPSTRIAFSLPEAGEAEPAIYNIAGQLVRTLADRPFTAGDHALLWNGRDDAGRPVASGVYVAQLTTQGRAFVQAMTLVR